MLNLQKSDITEGVITAHYEAKHTQPGGRGTSLTLDVIVKQDTRFGKTTARAVLSPEINEMDPEAALDKLADWAERLAIALKHRGTSSNRIPVYDNPVRPEAPEPEPDPDE